MQEPKFYLSPTRRLPLRVRESSTVSEHAQNINYYTEDGGTEVLLGSWSEPYVSGCESRILDADSPHRSHDVWHDVIHDKVSYTPHAAGIKGYLTHCKHPFYYRGSSEPSIWMTSPLGSVMDVGDILKTEQFQDAYEGVCDEWFTKLYSFHPEQLPDMSVFLVELRETWGMANLLVSYAHQLRTLLMKQKDIRTLIGGLDLDIQKSYAKKQFVRARKLELEKLSKTEILNDLSSTILSWRFGVQAPVRDIQKIIASLYGYWDALKYVPTDESIRRTFFLDTEVQGAYANPYGNCAYGTPSLCDWCTGLRPGDPVTYKSHAIKCDLTCTVRFRNQLLGSDLEQIGYAILSQLGSMPDIRSIWEMTKLSWFLDYFVRLGTYFLKFSQRTGIGIMQNPIVYQSALSLKVSQETRMRNLYCPDCDYFYNLGPVVTTHYERLVNNTPIDFTHLIRFFRAPSMNQGVNAAALALQMLTGRVIAYEKTVS